MKLEFTDHTSTDHFQTLNIAASYVDSARVKPSKSKIVLVVQNEKLAQRVKSELSDLESDTAAELQQELSELLDS